MGKKALCLIFAFLLSIESFAAIVSDNDGSAFITKAEFEALKENFADQVVNYNNSIDEKIDGAIANYLAGIRLAKTTSESLLVKEWDDYVMMNGSLSNDFAYPDVSGNIALLEYRKNNSSMTDEEVVNPTSSTSDTYVKLVHCWASFSYKNSKTSNGLNLVTNVDISASGVNTNNVTWAGRAANATESWALSKIATWENNTPGHDPAYLDVRYENEFIISQYLNLACDGYVASWINTSNPQWIPTVRWRYLRKSDSYDSYQNWGEGNCKAISSIPTITYDKNNDGKTYIYEHVGNFKKDTEWEVSVKNVTNYASKSSNNSKRTSGWSSLVTTKSAKWTGTEIYVQGGTVQSSRPVGFKTYNDSSFSNNTSAGGTNNYQIPTIGLLKSKLKAEDVYQYEKIVDGDGNEIPRLKMHQGMPLMSVAEGEIIEWEPQFKNISVTGMTGINECKFILSYKPFVNQGSVSDNKDYVKIDGVPEATWVTTSSKKAKIKFESDRKGYVYMKWVPNVDSSIYEGDTHWEVTLDLAKCNTYQSTKEQ